MSPYMKDVQFCIDELLLLYDSGALKNALKSVLNVYFGIKLNTNVQLPLELDHVGPRVGENRFGCILDEFEHLVSLVQSPLTNLFLFTTKLTGCSERSFYEIVYGMSFANKIGERRTYRRNQILEKFSLDSTSMEYMSKLLTGDSHAVDVSLFVVFCDVGICHTSAHDVVKNYCTFKSHHQLKLFLSPMQQNVLHLIDIFVGRPLIVRNISNSISRMLHSVKRETVSEAKIYNTSKAVFAIVDVLSSYTGAPKVAILNFVMQSRCPRNIKSSQNAWTKLDIQLSYDLHAPKLSGMQRQVRKLSTIVNFIDLGTFLYALTGCCPREYHKFINSPMDKIRGMKSIKNCNSVQSSFMENELLQLLRNHGVKLSTIQLFIEEGLTDTNVFRMMKHSNYNELKEYLSSEQYKKVMNAVDKIPCAGRRLQHK